VHEQSHRPIEKPLMQLQLDAVAGLAMILRRSPEEQQSVGAIGGHSQ